MLYEGAKPNELQRDLLQALILRLAPVGVVLALFGGIKLLLGLSVHPLFAELLAGWGIVLVGFRVAMARSRDARVMRRLLTALYVVEALFLASFSWLVGGVHWLGWVGFLFMVVYGNLTLDGSGGRVVTALAIAAYGAAVWLEWAGVLPHRSLFIENLPTDSGAYVFFTFVSTSAVLGVLGWGVSRFARMLKERGAQAKASSRQWSALHEGVSAKHRDLLAKQKELLAINQKLTEQNEELSRSQNVILTLATALESKDRYTEGHSLRVAQYALVLAKRLGMDAAEQRVIKNGSILHDVGKLHISDMILTKQGGLTDEEYETIKAHPAMGEKIVRPLHYCKPYLDIIRHHHERMDGKGYPDGLKGGEISLQARMVAIADAFDAMTSQRPYRKAMSHDEAFARLREHAGQQWDEELVKLFIEGIGKQGRKLWPFKGKEAIDILD